MDYGTPHATDDEREETTTTATTTAEEFQDLSSLREPQSSSPGSLSHSSSSSEERDPLEELSPQELALLLWKEETQAYIRALQQHKSPAPLSAGSTQMAVTIGHEAATVSEVGPVSPSPTTAVDNSLSSSTTTADSLVPAPSPSTTDNIVSTTPAPVDRSVVQKTGLQPSSATPANSPQLSANQTTPSLGSPVTRPLLVDVAAVAVTAADLRRVPRLTGSSDQNVLEILSHFRAIVGLKAKRVRPNDDKLGDMVALEHVALLGEGHCLTLIQQLVTGKIDISTASVSSEPDTPGSFKAPTT